MLNKGLFMKKPWKVAVMGECMVELYRDGDHLVQTYGGDTFNTSAYLRRVCGDDVKVDYISALGKGDSFSEGMAKFWEANGVGSSLTRRIDGRLPGLYAIEVDDKGERSFLYWRNEAAVRDCFDGQEGDALLQKLQNYNLVYLSGISLAVLKPESREKFTNRLKELSKQGIKIAFDFNYRPNVWKSHNENPAEFYKNVCAVADWVFLSPEELEAAGIKAADLDSEEFKRQLKSLGAKEVVVKNGDKPCLVYNAGTGDTVKVDVAEKLVPIDTTAAGDSFTAAYLGGLLYDLPVKERIKRAQQLAASVIMYHGAIIPENVTPHIFQDLQS